MMQAQRFPSAFFPSSRFMSAPVPASTPSSFASTPSSLCPFGDGSVKKMSTQQKQKRTQRSKWNTEILSNVVQKADVLMSGGKGNGLSRYFEGTGFYLRQIHRFRPHYNEKHTDKTRKQLIIQRIVESVWEQDGRFLVFNEKTGTLACALNHSVLVQVKRDLERGVIPVSNGENLVETETVATSKKQQKKKERETLVAKRKQVKKEKQAKKVVAKAKKAAKKTSVQNKKQIKARGRKMKLG